MRSLVALALLGLAVPASAQERIVHLGSGQESVWEVLREEGCTDDQIAKIWKLVAFESGLEPIEELYSPRGHPIVIKRDCEGRPLQEAESTRRPPEAPQPKTDNGLLKQVAELQKEVEELGALKSTSPPESSSGWLLLCTILLGVSLVLVGVSAFLYLRSRSAHHKSREVVPTPVEAEATAHESRETNLTSWEDVD